MYNSKCARTAASGTLRALPDRAENTLSTTLLYSLDTFTHKLSLTGSLFVVRAPICTRSRAIALCQ